ncbi:M28 family peptidase [Massilia sp. TWP1-3-3]|uniref:M28 family peptidase n=1 Tax=Massilia sp. TWP1-3-3 TaxID=2804573 RepID=UPI003CED7915
MPPHFIKLIFILAVLVIATMAAAPTPPSLDARLAHHVGRVATVEHNTGKPAALEDAATYIETTLAALGYNVRRQQYGYNGQTVRNLEVSLINSAGRKAPDRIFIIGAHYDSAPGAPGANDNGSGSGTAAVLELARMLKGIHLSQGTELKFVFFVNEEPPYFGGRGMGSWQHASDLRARGQPVAAALILETVGYYSQAGGSQRYPPGLENRYPNTGNFIAFVGTQASSELVRKALAAFKAASPFPAEGLAAASYVEGVTWSDHTSYNRHGYPAIMITDTAFLRYPYYHTADDTRDKLDYPSMARVVEGLAKVIEGIAAPVRM